MRSYRLIKSMKQASFLTVRCSKFSISVVFKSSNADVGMVSCVFNSRFRPCSHIQGSFSVNVNTLKT